MRSVLVGGRKQVTVARDYRASTEAMARALELLLDWNQGRKKAAGAGRRDDAKESFDVCTAIEKYT